MRTSLEEQRWLAGIPEVGVSEETGYPTRKESLKLVEYLSKHYTDSLEALQARIKEALATALKPALDAARSKLDGAEHPADVRYGDFKPTHLITLEQEAIAEALGEFRVVIRLSAGTHDAGEVLVRFGR